MKCPSRLSRSPERENPKAPGALRRGARGHFARPAFTLLEVMIVMTIMPLLALVIGGLVFAVQTAWNHTQGLEETTAQSRAVIERVRFMVSQAGVYELPGSPTQAGIAVLPRLFGPYELPETLVVWSGGPTGGMAGQGVQPRLPLASELVVYIPADAAPNELLEVTFPGNSTPVDFRSVGFPATVRLLLASPGAQQTMLANRLRKVLLDGVGAVPGSVAGSVRFELETSPDDVALSTTLAGTQAWYELTWPQGMVSSTSGVRQATLRIELQCTVRDNEDRHVDLAEACLPVFGSASYQYVYRP